jgi:hypothetical protein
MIFKAFLVLRRLRDEVEGEEGRVWFLYLRGEAVTFRFSFAAARLVFQVRTMALTKHATGSRDVMND